ncbi:VWA domain-containing protein [Nocardioides deserti]|uniref:Mg-protoporphyrin IX chelatase n=1 Tax=Nocardioides deserti TaxID=1588644 RepID=A0ABR6U4A2_9ACTN|nr:VWA domain-containing protein [Nocardioides deserti]MBC2959218.1 VWA domain-containing protein [Nocardioides deserti]GGO68360.1 magnesium chelatase [Nocardioides deserti]
MGLALVLTAVSPGIGGVLVRGEKGTAKSTTVRGLAEVMPAVEVHEGDRFSVDPADGGAVSPDGPFGPGRPTRTRPVRLVELPVGATEDRLLGSIQLEKALTSGAVELEPGLLARAHRGVLYVDEVNLLHDHLVDLLLDAAATGTVTVERDGISLHHAARFVLIGTMNPEEGELRPQLLDRFGLTVEVAAPRDPALRAEVVRRRLAFDADPDAFAEQYAARQADLTRRIADARARVGSVVVTDAALLKVAEVCAAFEVDGLRADIVTTRTAAAHAAWAGRDRVTLADIRAAALLALPHRRRRNPFDAPGLDEDLLDRVLGDEELPEPDPDPDPQPEPPGGGDDPQREAPETEGSGGPGHDDHADQQPDQQPDQPSDQESDQPAGNQDEQEPDDQPAPQAPPAPSGSGGDQPAARSGTAYRPRLLTVDGVGEGNPGRRSRARATSGRRVGASTGHGSLHLVETLRAAAERSARQGAGTAGGRVRLQPVDLRTAVREGREANLLLFCVDASGSMAARRRMAQVKTAVLSLLTDAYRRRDKVALVGFRGREARLLLPPTGSVEVAAALLDDLPSGGRTPLAEGLLEAERVLRRERLRDPHLRPLLVLVTDGRATAGPDAVDRSRRAAAHLAGQGVPSVVVDCEQGPLRMGLARTLAGHLRAEHVPMEQVSADGLVEVVAGRADSGPATGRVA